MKQGKASTIASVGRWGPAPSMSDQVWKRGKRQRGTCLLARYGGVREENKVGECECGCEV